MADEYPGDVVKLFRAGGTDYDVEAWRRGDRHYVDVYPSHADLPRDPIFESAGNAQWDVIEMAAEFLAEREGEHPGDTADDLHESFEELEA